MDRLTPIEGLPDVLRPFVQPCDVGLRTVSDPIYYGTIAAVARQVRPRMILEFGVRFGYSAIAMLHGQGGSASYVGVDSMFDGLADANMIAIRNLRQMTRGAVTIIQRDTSDEDLPSMLERADLIMVDADHFHVKTELALAFAHLRPGGVIIVDDMDNYRVANDSFEYLREKRGIEASDRSQIWFSNTMPILMVLHPCRT